MRRRQRRALGLGPRDRPRLLLAALEGDARLRRRRDRRPARGVARRASTPMTSTALHADARRAPRRRSAALRERAPDAATRDGAYRWVLSRGVAVRDRRRRRDAHGRLADRHHRAQAAEEQLLHEAFHDALTGLPNRALFIDRLGRAIGRAQRRPELPLRRALPRPRRFKVVNDSLGHATGDELLDRASRRAAATRCARAPGDTVARLGGDEFTILLDDICRRRRRRPGRRAHPARSWRAPFHVGGHEVFTTGEHRHRRQRRRRLRPARGPAARRRHRDVPRQGAAARRATSSSTRRCTTGAVARLQLETDLRRAIERERVLRSTTSRSSTLGPAGSRGFEALVRWQHPERGPDPPGRASSRSPRRPG